MNKKKTTKQTHIDLSTIKGAYEDIPTGATYIALGKIHKMIGKRRMNWHTCPYCGGTDNWHSNGAVRSDGNIMIGNVYRTKIRYHEDDCESLAKYNLCFKCGREWIMEIFIKRIMGDTSETKT